MKLRTWIASGLLVATQMAYAGGSPAVPVQESSMLLKGDISVDATGTVVAHRLDKEEAIPPGVVAFLRERIPHWRFKPMQEDGVPVGARNTMRILLVATQIEGGGFEMRLQAASFDPLDEKQGYTLVSQKMLPPKFPREMARAGVSGTAFVLVRVGRDGAVQSSFVEQVNLHDWGSEAVMQKMRESFAESARDAARRWRFAPPTRGDRAADASWTVRVPIQYLRHKQAGPLYGKWVGYIPGPRSRPDWIEPDLLLSSPEALPEGTASMLAGDGLNLLTPLGEGT